MGQKAHPYGYRLSINKPWLSSWYSRTREGYVDNFIQDVKIREFIEKRITEGGISHIEIARPTGKVIVTIHTSKPGIIIGRSGEAIEKMRENLNKKFQNAFEVQVQEIRKPESNAKLLGEIIAKQIEKRMPYRRAVKQGIQRARELGVKGIKIKVSGRLNGAEIARKEMFSEGKLPLQTIRADIDYAHVPANTTYGVIGVKVWLYKGEIFEVRATTQKKSPRLSEAAK